MDSPMNGFADSGNQANNKWVVTVTTEKMTAAHFRRIVLGVLVFFDYWEKPKVERRSNQMHCPKPRNMPGVVDDNLQKDVYFDSRITSLGCLVEIENDRN